ncbi:SIS domain-containing protein [Streptomyces sp. ISL-12]|uniref:SIS domain-containing protein n=1 Tax=Streptomyces sp. ISL-12 TaxID=2819177 RepID=UPI001BECA8F7|nr:SIS domain-containing protein [Streptomyces sp. ISL-12]MBT2409912.1 SIS domain-containing protein [Streptomyces sp. ISL-12]
MTGPSPSSPAGYLADIDAQPDALLRQADSPLPAALSGIDLGRYDRVVLTGMGSSLYSFVPVERALAAAGLPVWRLDAGQLLDTPERITPGTLLWATSQSGRSGELVALLDRLTGPARPRTVLATTDDSTSPLALAADVLVELRSGPEATVSTKSYVNTLAAHRRVLAALHGGENDQALTDGLRRTAEELRTLLAGRPLPTGLAGQALAAAYPRFAYVGTGADAATALTGALITKEASRVAAEGYVGGAFRHGPLELAGPGLTVLLFGTGDADDAVLPALARDLTAAGSTVVTVGPRAYPGTGHLPTPAGGGTFERLVFGMAHVQQLTVALARAAGQVPGEFRFGRKITDTL